MQTIEHSSAKKIFITGASSGIGYQASLKMLKQGNKIILPCRDKITRDRTLERFRRDNELFVDVSSKTLSPIIDLSDLNSIKETCDNLIKNQVQIDILILNAGLQYTGAKKPRFSAQGFELTFATNHLGHLYLTSLLLPLLYKSKCPRIVITSSEVHNPMSAGGQIGKPASLGNLQGLASPKGFTMLDGSNEFSADKAYKDSKLCNILFAKALIRKLKDRGLIIPVITWAPGLVIPKGREGFFKYSRSYNELGQILFAFIARDLAKISVPTEVAGSLLNDLATNEKYNDLSFKYYSNKNIGYGLSRMDEATVSKEAEKIGLPEKLWNHSCNLLNIDSNLP